MRHARWEPVTADNYEAVIELEVREEQRDFVAPNVRSLADAWAHPAARPLVLLAEEEFAGFALLAPVASQPRTIALIRFMIDRRFQHRGLGRAGITALIEAARADGYTTMRLSVVPSNHAARALYATSGFRETGAYEDGEIVLQRPLALPASATSRTAPERAKAPAESLRQGP
ncbi:GNAT family N-acetyltransferase [Streptomyces sp. NPDC054796]